MKYSLYYMHQAIITVTQGFFSTSVKASTLQVYKISLLTKNKYNVLFNLIRDVQSVQSNNMSRYSAIEFMQKLR
jgi:hypothetical protein